jgi:toxin FitB
LSHGFLLDTNVVSEFAKAAPDRRVERFLAERRSDDFWISDITVAEIRFGVDRLEAGPKKAHFADVLANAIRPMFHGRVVSADEDTWLLWKHKQSEARLRRHTFPQPDLVIACLALQHSMTVVTRDTNPFREAGAAFVNPWDQTSG